MRFIQYLVTKKIWEAPKKLHSILKLCSNIYNYKMVKKGRNKMTAAVLDNVR